MTTLRTPEILERLNADGHVVIEDLIPKSMTIDLRDRVERILERERANPADPGDSDISAHDFFWVASWVIGIPGLVLSLITGAGYLTKIRAGVTALRLRA